MTLVLVDAGPLIALGKLNRLHLLTDLYGTIFIPRFVHREVVVAGAARGAPDAITIRVFLERHGCPIVDTSDTVMDGYAPPGLGAGERQLLALARELRPDFLLLDDELARSEARRLGLTVRGTVGVLVQAYQTEFLRGEEIELLLLEIAARPDLWISERLCREVLAHLGLSS